LSSFKHVLDALAAAAAPDRPLRDFAAAFAYWQEWSRDPARRAHEWPCHADLEFFVFRSAMLSHSESSIDLSGSSAEANAVHAVPRLEFVPNLRRKGGGFRSAGGRAATYVRSIVKENRLPTRLGNLHDFANALTWALFPRSKWVLFCGLQAEYERMAQSSPESGGLRLEPGRGRTPRADWLTLLDEAGVIGLGDGESPSSVCFGHALIEHLAQGGAPVNAPLLELPGLQGADDAAVASRLFQVIFVEPFLPEHGSRWIH
jgi:hypothetical protein